MTHDDAASSGAEAVSLPPMVERQTQAWTALLSLAPSFGRHWTLIGGQMVLLLQAERSSPHVHWTPRASDDLDMVVNLRASKTAMRDICSGHKGWQQGDGLSLLCERGV